MLPFAGQLFHVLVSGIFVPAIVVDDAASGFRTVYEHNLFQFVMRSREVGYTFIFSNGIIQYPGFQCIGGIVQQCCRQGEVGLEYLMTIKAETFLAFHFLDDGGGFVGFEVSFYSMIGKIMYGVSCGEVISGNAYYQATLLLIGSR